MDYHARMKALVRERKATLFEMYWLAGVSLEDIPDGLRELIEESDPLTLGALFGTDVEGFIHPEEFSAEDFLGVLYQMGVELDGFLARIVFPVRYYGKDGGCVMSNQNGYTQEFYARTPEELVDLVEQAAQGFDALDQETGDQVRSGEPLFVECDCEECSGEDEGPSVH